MKPFTLFADLATHLDGVITTVAEAAGKLIPSSDRAVAEESLSDMVEGLKVDDTAAAATVIAAPAPAAPVAS